MGAKAMTSKPTNTNSVATVSETPETDAEIFEYEHNGYPYTAVDPEFARELERQRDQARRERDADKAEIRYWRETSRDVLNRKNVEDGLSHAERISYIRLKYTKPNPGEAT
jgi:hypothetical protein